MQNRPDDFNPFDELGFGNLEQTKEQISEWEKHCERLDHLIHRTFAQNEAGAELLEEWTQALIMTPTARAGDDLLAIGINEGVKQFIRNIHATVKKVERGEE